MAHWLSWPLLRSKFHSPLPLPFLGPQPKLVLLLRIRKRLYPGISLPRLLSPGLEAPSQGPSPPSLPESQGSVRLINKVPWQPGAGRVADGRTGRGRVAAAGPAPRPCREGLPIKRPIPRGLEGQACTWQRRRRVSRGCLQQSPSFISNKQLCALTSHRFCSKPATSVQIPAPPSTAA